MRKICLFSGMIFLAMFTTTHAFGKKITAAPAGFPGIISHSVASPWASFDKLWVDYDVVEDGVKGMRIHVKFTVHEMKGMDAYMAIYFENERGSTLKDKNNKFNSTEGDVAVYKSIKPDFDPADYNDLQVFMPYEELDLDPGNYDLSMDVKLIYKQGGTLQKLTTYDFQYTKPGAGGNGPDSGISATFGKVWVDYDVYDNERKGMRIHVKFSVSHMKNVDSYIAIYFQKKNGDKLTSTNTTYRSKNGQLALYKSLLPNYEETDYDDLQLFMPYGEINTPSGRQELVMDMDLILKNGDLVKHLTYSDFWFE